MASGLSVVKLPPSISYWDLYRKAPILLQALITIAGSNEPTLYRDLGERMRESLQNEFFNLATRRLDLIQGLLA